MEKGDNILKAGVIGWPVSHSLSPRLHGYWIEKYGVKGSYEALPVEPEAFPSLLKTLEAKGFRGANITVPYKESMLSLVPDIDHLARRIGAVNTIVWEDGQWHGTNTDAYGFMENVYANSDIWKDGPALVFGAGGAARAICVGLLDQGYDVVLTNRTMEKAEAVKHHLNHKHLTVKTWTETETMMGDATLVVNTTTLGMKGQPPLEISMKNLPTQAYVADIVYNPEPTERTRRYSNPTVTDFLARASERGNCVIDGLGMLLYQAQPGFERWFGVRPDVTRSLRSHVLEGLFHEQKKA